MERLNPSIKNARHQKRNPHMQNFLKYSILLSAIYIYSPAYADEPIKKISEVNKTSTIDESKEKSKLEKLIKTSQKLGISNEDLRPEQQKSATLFGRPLIIGGEIRTILSAQNGYDLEKGAKDAILELTPSETLEFFWLPSDNTAVFASARGTIESLLYKEAGKREDAQLDLALRNFWFLQTNLFDTPFAVQVGRQRMQDDREWWWDEQIDAARLHYFGSDITAYLGVGMLNQAINTSELDKVKPKDQDLLRYFANIDWKWSKGQHLEFFATHQNDQSTNYITDQFVSRSKVDDADARITWLGARATGCVKKICYWGDVARMHGTETEYDLDGFNAQTQIVDKIETQKLRGFAYDVGISVELPLAFKPQFTISHAKGSGDKPKTPGKNGAYRQTGIHQNEGKYEGNSRFQYYGEVLRPNLSNIQITSLALGIPVAKYGWVETIWHDYRQEYADNRISGASINENPNGANKRLGQEIDIIMSYRPTSAWEFELTAGAFRSGRAFEEDVGRWAKLIEFRVDYNF